MSKARNPDHRHGRKERESIMRCLCGKEFTAVRSTAKFCSARCRKAAFLSVQKASPVSVPVSVPCPDCAALSLEVKTLLAKVAQLEAQLKGKAPDDASLYQRVVAEKTGRISSHSTGHTIGTIR